MSYSYHELNAELNLYDENGNVQFSKDKEADRSYYIDNINQKTVFFHRLEEKLEYLV